MTRTLHVATPSRAVTLLLAASFAAAGAWGLGAQSASATPGDPHKVWVCKYVHKPGEAEVLKGGKNPIHVDAAALTNDRGVAPQLGDSFSDGQFRSVVVSLDEEAPTDACPTAAEPDSSGGVVLSGSVSSPPTTTPVTPTAPSTATATTAPVEERAMMTPAASATASQTEVVGLGGVEAPATVALAPIPALGDGAPDTGGLGQVAERSGTVDIVVGATLLALAGGLLAAWARRRRSSTVEVD